MPDAALPETAGARTRLQGLAWPDPTLPTDMALYARLQGARAGVGRLHLDPGGSALFDTWVNLLNLGTWQRHCRLDGLWLRLSGVGRITLQLSRTHADGTGTALPGRTLALNPAGIEIDLSDQIDGNDGLLTLGIRADTAVRLDESGWLTRTPPDAPPPQLAIGITTFRREAEVAATAARIAAYLDRCGDDGLAAARLFIIDNGQSAAPVPHPRLTLIPNRNLGGAGGFARVLEAAQAGGFSHCLFMDDDAAFPMENLARTAAFLRLARSPQAALAGAMISTARPWAMWEYGSVFDRACRPQFIGTDLRDRDGVVAMELAAPAPKPPGFYGGWWYFAFPLAAVRHWPFPFFVRGDDISFSLANRFETATLNGVMSLQEDFGRKESPQTLYLDLRNHLHHHLVQDGMEIGAARSAWIALRFVLRSIIRMHYGSALAQCLAWEDVMVGPQHFAANIDMAAKRAEIAALPWAADEVWKPLATLPPAPGLTPPRETPPHLLSARLLQATLNGHLLPFWRLYAAERRIDIDDRALIWPLWGAARARFVDTGADTGADSGAEPGAEPDVGRGYEVRHSKRRAFAVLVRALGLAWRWRSAYTDLRAAYRSSYPEMTARAFWQAAFGPGDA